MSYDLIVVGFGAAGACAAIEAAEAGLSVLVLDRFEGGGASAISGGVIYAGGGTSVQLEAGVDDSFEAMLAYLKLETQGVVSEQTLNEFCRQSVEGIEWLKAHGLCFEASLCPHKTSYPSDRYFLYYSGNEAFSPYKEAAKPAPRGHRVLGKGLPGGNLFAPLKAAALKAGVTFWAHAIGEQLELEEGRVVGISGRRLLPGLFAWAHAKLERLALKITPYRPLLSKRLRRFARRLHAKHSVIFSERSAAVALTSGGFIYNRKRVKIEAPRYRKGMPLGTAGCDGSGIAMGESVGGASDHMERISAWRFINPPFAFAQGMLVDGQGSRFVNEALYGAAIGEAIVEKADGRAFLIIDSAMAKRATKQVGRGKAHWFQTAPALLNLWFNSRKASSFEELASRCRMDPKSLTESATLYNNDDDDAQQKPSDFCAPLTVPPFRAIDCSIGSKVFPLPTLTLGGLRVEAESGKVLRADNSPIEGLYAAGRAAVGVCSRSYVSGLSLADCIFSGRRLAKHLLKDSQ